MKFIFLVLARSLNGTRQGLLLGVLVDLFSKSENNAQLTDSSIAQKRRASTKRIHLKVNKNPVRRETLVTTAADR